MKSVISRFVVTRSIFSPRLMILCAVLALSGCKSYGPFGMPDFDPTFSRTLEKNEKLLFSAPTELVEGTFMEAEEEQHPSYRGMLLLTSERMMFGLWNENQQRYEPAIWTDYAHIEQIKMHNNILLQYIAIIATDGSKFTYMLGTKSVDAAYAVLMKQVQNFHQPSKSEV